MKNIFNSIIVSFISFSVSAGDLPNVVFILADDLGVYDLSLYGSRFHETPNIDALAKRGMKFTQAYSANPLCSPTRASILTGLYPSRIGITEPLCHNEEVVLKKELEKSAASKHKALTAVTLTRLKTEYYTLAEAFKDHGYSTAHFGKWHLGAEPYSPLEQGFDIDIPHTPAPSPLPKGFFYPFPVWQDYGKPGDNLEDLIADEAVKYIHEHKNEPFFLNYWAFQVHSPWQAKKYQIDKFRAKVDPSYPQRNPVYAGMLETLDDVVGRLVSALGQAETLDNTIIIFVGDNGPFFTPNKSHMPEEFHDVPVSSAAPLREGKGTIYEGGTRVPLIVIWPDRVRPGSVSHFMQQSTDFFPTFVDMFGWDVPNGIQFDGVSMRPTLEENRKVRDEIFCHYPRSKTPSTSLRSGDWKLIRWYCDSPEQKDRYELYNIKNDVGESKNLISSEPVLLTEMIKRMDELIMETEGLVPIPNPAYVSVNE
jgi:arylsulfatase A-like enzyme